MPESEHLRLVGRESLVPGTVLGTLKQKLDAAALKAVLQPLDERLPIYRGLSAPAHPSFLLGLSNQILMRNVALGPWIHTASDVINWGAARCGQEVSVRGRIAAVFERKGHEFVTLDVLVLCGTEIVQQVRHTAIYQLRTASH